MERHYSYVLDSCDLRNLSWYRLYSRHACILMIIMKPPTLNSRIPSVSFVNPSDYFVSVERIPLLRNPNQPHPYVPIYFVMWQARRHYPPHSHVEFCLDASNKLNIYCGNILSISSSLNRISWTGSLFRSSDSKSHSTYDGKNISKKS